MPYWATVIVNAPLGREIFLHGYYDYPAGHSGKPIPTNFGRNTFETIRPDRSVDFRKVVDISHQQPLITIDLDPV